MRLAVRMAETAARENGAEQKSRRRRGPGIVRLGHWGTVKYVVRATLRRLSAQGRSSGVGMSVILGGIELTDAELGA